MKTEKQQITGKCNDRLSWERQSVYDLSNGVRATVEFGHYGDMVARLDDSLGYWHCSNGLASLPERFAFALDWVAPYLAHDDSAQLMFARFARA